MTEEKKIDRFYVIILVGMMALSGATGLVIAEIAQDKDCPDCNLICPDVVDYGEDYEGLLIAISESLNRSEGMNSLIYNELKNDGMDNLTKELDDLHTRLFEIQQIINWYANIIAVTQNDLNHTLYNIYEILILIYNQTDEPRYPEDHIQLNIMDSNTTFRIYYYDNIDLAFKLSPPFTIQNWTEFPEWVMLQEQAHDIFTNYQRNAILLFVCDVAYYKETGTWLGE